MESTRNMFRGVTATAAGQTYNIDRDNLQLQSYDGMGLMSLRRVAQKASGQIGDTDLSYRQDARFVGLGWQIVGRDLEQYFDIREELLEIFQPRINDPITLTFSLAGSRQRAIKVNLDGDLDFVSGQRTHTLHGVSAILKASDPRFYDPTQRTISSSPIAVGEGWTIPWEIPWKIARTSFNVTVSIDYAGGSRIAAPEYPVITIYGPIANPAVINETTDEQIELDGLELAAGQYVVVDLGGGPFSDASPTIRDDTGASVEQYLTTTSDIFNWHLAPAGEVLFDGTRADGTNLIRLVGEGSDDTTYLLIEHYDRYRGV